MTIALQHLIPIPLKDKFSQRTSDIWNQSLTFSAKQFIKIKAPSGTGKTTFIHSVYGIREDYLGKVLYDDQDIKAINIEAIAAIRQQKVSIIFQDLRLFENLTALENIQLKRSMHTPFEDEKRMYEMIDILGVRHILQQPAKICSYGEQQRIAIIRALMQPFEWLLMDEPFSHLDNANTEKAARLIEVECEKRNAGFLLTDLDDDSHFKYHHFLQL